jgi:hypothetical protein
VTNDLANVLEFLAVFFLGISALLVLMVRLEAGISQSTVSERRPVPAVTPADVPPAVAAGADV